MNFRNSYYNFGLPIQMWNFEMPERARACCTSANNM